MASNKYGKTDSANCPECSIVVLKNEAHLAEGRTVVASRNANKKVSPSRFFCMECYAAGEYKQFQLRVQQSAEMAKDFFNLSDADAFKKAFDGCLAAEIRAWAPVLAERAKTGRR